MFKPTYTGERPSDQNRSPRVKNILRLRQYGKRVIELTPYHFRVNETIDLYPVHGRFHNIRTGERGFYPADN